MPILQFSEHVKSALLADNHARTQMKTKTISRKRNSSLKLKILSRAKSKRSEKRNILQTFSKQTRILSFQDELPFLFLCAEHTLGDKLSSVNFQKPSASKTKVVSFVSLYLLTIGLLIIFFFLLYQLSTQVRMSLS